MIVLCPCCRGRAGRFSSSVARMAFAALVWLCCPCAWGAATVLWGPQWGMLQVLSAHLVRARSEEVPGAAVQGAAVHKNKYSHYTAYKALLREQMPSTSDQCIQAQCRDIMSQSCSTTNSSKVSCLGEI